MKTTAGTMTVREAAQTLRGMSTSERDWVKLLTERHAIPYVLGFRPSRPEAVLADAAETRKYRVIRRDERGDVMTESAAYDYECCRRIQLRALEQDPMLRLEIRGAW
jgi:hypothetical protein